MTGGKDFQHELLEKIKNLAPGKLNRTSKPASAAHPKIISSAEIKLRPPVTVRSKPHILVVGSSTGGPQALFSFFKGLNGKLPVPALVTQHMPPNFTKILAQHLTKSAGLPADAAQDGELLRSGQIYVAPGDYHMQVHETDAKKKITLNQGPPENYCRPAVNPMLRSVAQLYGSNVLVVILNGMGYDGMKGGQDIVAAGGTIIAQDEKTSVVWGMPGAVASAGLCTAVLPIDELAPYVAEFMNKGM